MNAFTLAIWALFIVIGIVVVFALLKVAGDADEHHDNLYLNGYGDKFLFEFNYRADSDTYAIENAVWSDMGGSRKELKTYNHMSLSDGSEVYVSNVVIDASTNKVMKINGYILTYGAFEAKKHVLSLIYGGGEGTNNDTQ